jgi:protease-4
MEPVPPPLQPPPPAYPGAAANYGPARPPRRTGWIVYSIIVTVMLLFSLLLNMTLFVATATKRDRSARHKPQFEEQLIAGEASARAKIAVIYLTGLISSTTGGALTQEGMAGDIRAQLDQAVEDRDVKAIILRINSPGGEVVASDAIYNAIVQARAHKPVVASMESLGASGAYYIAVGADHIIARDLTITGSIGVILESFTVTGLMDKIGVKSHTFKSGPYKDVLNPTREPTDSERQLVQDLIMEVYDKFVEIVATERELPLNEFKTSNLADGRILTGLQAERGGLIDELGSFDDAIEAALELAKLDDARVVTYLPPFTFRNLFRLFGEDRSVRTRIEIDLLPSRLRLEPGQLYFLPPHLFP